jgi:hypothetical protein
MHEPAGTKLRFAAMAVLSMNLHLPPMEDELGLDRLRAIDPLNAEWVTLILLGSFFLLSLINLNSPRKWRLLTQAMFRMRLGRHALREEIDLRDRTFIGLLVVAVCVLALFIWQAWFLGTMDGSPAYPKVASLLFAVVVGQALVVRGIATLVKADGGLQEHLYTGLLLFILAGVVVLPLVVLMAYRAEWRMPLLWTGLIVLLMMLIYRWIRALYIGYGEGVPGRYIIIYLCGAEILPLLLLIHALRPSIPGFIHN